ncbi:MAG: T9SS type A sorting domain-containing protein [Chlorobi bacterium]|nr:T9SS type A sorting domain-containing protein [Chlorobiota bacterium]
MKRLKLSATILLMFGLATFIHAQEAITTGGGSASGDGGAVSYTIGQVFYNTATGSSGSVIEGVQQPYEIVVETGIEDAKDIDLGLSAYPNPTVDVLTLSVQNYESDKLSYQLFDIAGRLVVGDKVSSNLALINMSGYKPGVYILKVVDNNELIKTFKIIKK